MVKISDEALDLYEDAEAKHTFTHGGDYRRCCNRAGLEAAAPLIAAQVLRDAVERVERRGSLLCDCDGADSEPTNPSTRTRMDHHCDCQAVDAAAEMLGSGPATTHAAQCTCGGPTIGDAP
jgi:hypothetical protein